MFPSGRIPLFQWLPISLWLLCSPNSLGQDAKRGFSTVDYASAVHRYGQGDFKLASSAVARASERELEAAVRDYQERFMFEPQIKAAALLHTEAALLNVLNKRSSTFHLQRAIAWMERLDTAHRRPFERRWYLMLGYYHMALLSADAKPALEAAVKAFPDDIDVRLALGVVSENSGWMRRDESDLAKAETQYRIIQEKAPDVAEAIVRRGRVLTLLGRDDEALLELDRGVRMTSAPELELAARLSLGGLYARQNELPKAIESYRAAFALDPTCQSAVIALAHALRKAGDQSASLELIKRHLLGSGTGTGNGRSDADEGDLWWRYLLGHSDGFDPLLGELRGETRW